MNKEQNQAMNRQMRRLTEGLRHIADGRTPDGQSITVPAAYARAWLERNERLSAKPPQGDAADFCEHGYTTEDSAHPSAGLERCPTCSPSDEIVCGNRHETWDECDCPTPEHTKEAS